MESTSSSCGSHHHLPPGFRFHPTDEELVVHYLKKKVASTPLPVSIIAEIDLYKYDPWELPSKASFGEQEWYFFTPRDRKYPNGARPNRAATSGYWKATGTDKPIHTANGTQKVGVKKALVFYGGKPPKGIKSNWIMHEYRLFDNKPPGSTTFNNKGSLRLDDWVLCRIFKKSTSSSRLMDLGERDTSMDQKMLVSTPGGSSINGYQNPVQVGDKPAGHEPGLSFDNNYNENFFSEMLSGNGSTIDHHGTPMSIGQMTPSSSKPNFQKHMMSGYWNNATFNESTASFISMINENSENTADYRHNNTNL